MKLTLACSFWCLALLVVPALSYTVNTNTEAGGDLCPYPFTKVLDECFFLSDLKLTWTAARHYCRGMNSDLATPSSVPALHGHIRTVKFHHYVYLGATNTGQNKKWLWLDGRPVKTGDWHKHQPNNYQGNQHCLVMRYNEDPPLHDYPCGDLIAFVCQIKP